MEINLELQPIYYKLSNAILNNAGVFLTKAEIVIVIENLNFYKEEIGSTGENVNTTQHLPG